ncbi:trinucleotide repeat-containing gene 6C protein-like [Conger conger]|uniref:trinucleotide repeat-containing gene 6C protein-like n=1 Tax=Conger conger TaxID=82655 RepID=UPI002A5ADDE3|nr:trinucleotide repeat-containing gene 6C protein-like [Conger conger]
MEEKKKKKQEEKKKKDSAQKKAAEQKTKVPESAKPSPSPPQPATPSATPAVSTVTSNGKRPPSSVPQQPAAPRYPPREVPPRFRQLEHKQLLKRGQPLPAGALPLAPAPPGTLSPPHTAPGLPQPSSQRHAELPLQSGPGAQYEPPHWGVPPSSQSDSSSSWDQVIIDDSDTEAWPSISRGDSHAPPECAADTERAAHLSSSSSSSSSASMATGGAQQGHFPAHHPGNKAGAGHPGSSGPGPGGASRGWSSGAAHCPPGAGGEGKPDGPAAPARAQPCWNSSNFNLNLNPNANPAAWPVLGHEASGMGGNGGPPPNLCSPTGAAPAPGSNGNTGNGAWGDMMGPDASEPHPCPSTNVSFSTEPQNLNTDGPNHTKQEPLSPGPNLPSWGGLPAGMGSLAQPPAGASQVNGEGGSVWGNGEAKPAGSKDSGWDPPAAGGPGMLGAWGRGGNGNGSGASSAWGRAGGGDWGKHSSEAKGWEGAGSPPQEQLNSWSRPANAPTSEGSGDSQEGRGPRRDRTPSEEPAPPPPLPRQDLDPRVLCNTGWGQTPVRQHTVWDMEEAARADRKSHTGTEAWGSSPANPNASSGATGPNGGGPAPRPDSGGKAEAPGPGGWGAPAPVSNQPSSGWGEQPPAKKVPNGSAGWGDAPPGGPNASAPKASQSWGPEEKSPSWDDPPAKPKAQNWSEGPKPSHSWGGNGGGGNGGEWGEPAEGKRNGMAGTPWEGDGGGGGSWKENPRSWGKGAPGPGGGWGETQRPPPPPPPQSWGGKPPDGPSSNGSSGGSAGSWGGPGSVKQSGSGWSGGAGPGGNGAKQEPGGEPTGWEEPSPPSIRRKMEIDDGTSTWGDPNTYNKTVNMWDKNNPVVQSNPPPNANPPPPPSNNNNNHHHNHNHHHHHHPHHPHHNQPPVQNHGNNNGSPNAPPPHQPGPPPNRPPLVAPGWGDLPNVQPKADPSWGEPPAPAPSVDNGTSAWGKPPGSGTWGEGGHDGPGPYGRAGAPPGSAPCKPAPKPMQDGWGGGGEELGMAAGQWDPDDGDMWNSPASQESNSSCSSWGNPSKKGPPKGKGPNKQDDAWIMNRLIKQLTDMGFPRDPAEEALKSNNMNLDQAMSALLEKKTELDKRGMGISDYNNGLVSKALGCRPPAISKESSSDRTPYLDKDGGLVEDAPTSPFMPSPSLKLPLSSSGLPSQGLGGVASGLAMQNLNNRQPRLTPPPSRGVSLTGKLSDMKSTWSPGPISHSQASLSHELWKVPQGPRNSTAPSRPPPGLTNTKPSSTWGGSALGLAPGWSGSYSSAGTTWSTDSSSRTSSWLVLRNLTPQIDGSTLRTLCMQHGPLITFHLNLTQGNAVVRYSSKEEAAKAQKSLHMCVLGNTTILAEFAGEEEVNRFFAQGQSLTPTTSWQPNPGTNQTRLGGAGASHAMGHWNSGGLGGGGAKAGSDLLWAGVPQYSSLWGPPSGEEARVIGSPTPINTLLPGDLLSGESM